MNSSMKLIKRNGVYYVRYSRTKWRSLKTQNKEQATTIFNLLKKDHSQFQLAVLQGRSTTRLGDFMKDYLEYSQAHKSSSTYQTDRLAFKKLLDGFPPSRIQDQLTPRHLEVFVWKA